MVSLYGLVGRKLSHSFSRTYFTDKFREEAIEAEYKLFELEEISGLPDLISSYPTLKGLNVTVPYKEQVIDYLDALSDTAEAIGAVNTILIERDVHGHPFLIGHNTDAEGFRRSLLGYLGSCAGFKALVTGTGGAAKAVSYALAREGIEATFVSRFPTEKNLTGCVIGYEDCGQEIISDHHLIINTTPLGTFPDTASKVPLPYHLLTPGHKAFDLVYNPAVTAFMKACAERGCGVKNGLEMLYNQAELSWEIWQMG